MTETMREIPVDEVREGDVARTNGKELAVRYSMPSGMIRFEGPVGSFYMAPDAAVALGVTFHRPVRQLPDYPGALVHTKDNSFVLDADGDWWDLDGGCLVVVNAIHELGDDWREATSPPAPVWVPVDPATLDRNDKVRVTDHHESWAIETQVISVDTGARQVWLHYEEVPFDFDEQAWFKREEQTGASE